MYNKIRYFLLTLTLICAAQNIFSQVDLHRRISINVQNLYIVQTLHVIEQGNDFFFAYNSKQIPANRISISKQNITLKRALDEILSNRFTYTAIGNHVILRLKDINPKAEDFLIFGVVKSADGVPLDSAVVYAVGENKATITNKEGVFRLKLKEPSQYIHVSCPNYKDTLLVARTFVEEKTIELYPDFINNKIAILPLDINHISLVTTQTEFEQLSLVKELVPQSALYLNQQVKVNHITPVQISFLPGVGSQQLIKGLNINRFSLNVLAGYSKGVAGFEIGSVGNIIHGNVIGGQISGVTNIVTGSTKGLQMAGVSNHTFGKVRGIQISGVGNFNDNYIIGMQLAGVFNYNKGTMSGQQISGVVNVNLQQATGLQLAGVANIQSKAINGCQISGVYGIASSVTGVQLTGVMSHATRSVLGVQISSVLNKTKTLNGLQLGIVNIADTIENGLQIGLFNIIKNGYRAFEFTKDETYYCNFMYKTGGRRLYSILNAGIGDNKVCIGYGIGYIQPIYKKLSINLDAIYNSLILTNASDAYSGKILNFRLGANYSILKHLTLTGGMSFSMYDPNIEDDRSDFSGKATLTGNSNNIILQAFRNNRQAMWLGCFFGVKF